MLARRNIVIAAITLGLHGCLCIGKVARNETPEPFIRMEMVVGNSRATVELGGSESSKTIGPRKDIEIVATGRDAGGVRRVSVNGTLRFFCRNPQTGDGKIEDVTVLDESKFGPDTTAAGDAPTVQILTCTLRIGEVHQCPSGMQLLRYEGHLTATAENYAGIANVTPPLEIVWLKF